MSKERARHPGPDGSPSGLRLLIILGVLLAAATAAAAQTRVIAVADVHGAFPEFVAILQRTGVIDENRQWKYGSGVLVQTGDIPDRGPGGRQAYDLLMQLEKQAAAQGGKVFALLGNHEVMNIVGDLRYVSPAEYQTYAGPDSEKVREKAWQEYKRYMKGRRGRGLPPDEDAARAKWAAEYPPGYFEQREAYSPQGVYGKWLRSHDAVAQVGDVIFLHGGLDPKMKFKNLEEINEKVHRELATFDRLWNSLVNKNIIWRYMRMEQALREVADELQTGNRDQDMMQFVELQRWLINSPDGPLWYRGYAQFTNGEMNGNLAKLLDKLKAKHVVVGHSPTSSHKIEPKFENKVFLIDTGMLPTHYRGQASAVEFQNGRVTGHYADGQQQVLMEAGAAAGGAKTGS